MLAVNSDSVDKCERSQSINETCCSVPNRVLLIWLEFGLLFSMTLLGSRSSRNKFMANPGSEEFEVCGSHNNVAQHGIWLLAHTLSAAELMTDNSTWPKLSHSIRVPHSAMHSFYSPA